MNASHNNKLNGAINIFASMSFAMGLLIVLAIFSVIGTLIAQNKTVDFYRSTYGDPLHSVFELLDVYDMYHSWWYNALLACLLLSLGAGIWRHGIYILRAIKNVKQMPSLPKNYQTLKFQIDKTSSSSQSDIATQLNQFLTNTGFGKWLSTETDPHETKLFGRKGQYGKAGFFPIHVGIMVIILGGVVSAQFGFRGEMNIIDGQSGDTAYVRENNEFIPVKLPFKITNKKFEMDFYEIGKPSSYRTQLSVFEGEKQIASKTISVNDPLRLGDYTIYQSSFGDAGSTIEMIMTDLSNPDFPQQHIKSEVHKILRDEQGTQITITDLKEHTVLNLTQDPMKTVMRDVGPSLEITMITPSDGTIRYRSFLHFPKILSYTRFGEEQIRTEEQLGFNPSEGNIMKLLSIYMQNLYPQNRDGDSNGEFTTDQRREAFKKAMEKMAMPMNQAKVIGPAVAKTQEVMQAHQLPALFTFKSFERSMYTGLQVSKDPGAWIIWLGSILLMAGLLLVYIAEYRVWVDIKSNSDSHFFGEIHISSSRPYGLGLHKLKETIINSANPMGIKIEEALS